jgi:hypothetical protein
MGRDYLVEGVSSGVGSDEGDMVYRMPVSGGGFEGEGEGEERVDLRDDVTALRDGERAGLRQSQRWGGRGITGGQKSFCMSMTRSADLVGLNVAMSDGQFARVVMLILQ